jgi:hypothetical protein
MSKKTLYLQSRKILILNEHYATYYNILFDSAVEKEKRCGTKRVLITLTANLTIKGPDPL